MATVASDTVVIICAPPLAVSCVTLAMPEAVAKATHNPKPAANSKRTRKGAAVALEPANAAYETRIFGPDRVRVQGRLVALMRQY